MSSAMVPVKDFVPNIRTRSGVNRTMDSSVSFPLSFLPCRAASFSKRLTLVRARSRSPTASATVSRSFFQLAPTPVA
ncbi:hypothetical protein [Streptomyces sp. RTd22]|uniref:hypothetical protein n=1 Tax=Streptomyces sp. RTd22 TaxID=1841249 RepID=UPI0007C4882D|nr:hypothetical protein [Streptomyces sp. RTd22]